MPAFVTVPVDTITGTMGRRPSGAPLYHRGSQFGPPERRRLDRNLVAKSCSSRRRWIAAREQKASTAGC